MLDFHVFDILWMFSECSVTVVPGLYSENVGLRPIGLPSVQLGSALGLGYTLQSSSQLGCQLGTSN